MRYLIDTELLQDAITELRERGWIQDTLVTQSGRVCALGALNAAAKVGDLSDVFDNLRRKKFKKRTRSAKRLLVSVIEEQYPEYTVPDSLSSGLDEDDWLEITIASWNDVSGRTVDEVEALFEKAANK